jgi:transcriptional regulator with XRE-family HTH domain
MHSGSEQLKDWMRRRGFTQADACRFLGFDAASMSNFCAGKRTPGLETALRIERLTGIPVEVWASSELDSDETTADSEPVKAKR